MYHMLSLIVMVWSCLLQFERRYESLLKDVRSLEGTLADYNLAMDKLRTSTDPEEVRQYHREVCLFVSPAQHPLAPFNDHRLNPNK